MPLVDRNATVAQIALDHPSCVHVFRAHHIDFCCRGGLSLEEACAGKGVSPEDLLPELDAAARARDDASEDPRAMPTPRLIEHVVARHHAYLRKVLPFVEQLARKVARVHGGHDPKLPELAEVVAELRDALEPHLDDEERALFPALLGARSHARPIADELRAMHDEHLRVGELLTSIRALAGDYAAPEWACGSYRALMNELRAIELDTLRHVQIENHVLMPRFEGHLGSSPRSAAARARGVR